jgi:hypothetical protein
VKSSRPEPTTSSDDDLGILSPSRSAALQRRAMQAAMATAVRAMRSVNGRRERSDGRQSAPPAGRA